MGSDDWGSSATDDWGSTPSVQETKDNSRDNSRKNFKQKDDWGSSAKDDWSSAAKDDWGSAAGDRESKDNLNDSGRKRFKQEDSWGSSTKDAWGAASSTQEPKNNGRDGNRKNPRQNDDWGSSAKDSWGSAPSNQESKNNFKNGDRNNSKPKDSWGSTVKDDWGSAPSVQETKDDSEDGNRKKIKQEDGTAPAPYKPEELDLDEEARLQGDGIGENFQRYKDQKVTCIPKNLTPVEKFEDVVASKLLLKNIESQKYSDMTPIQKWAMPAIMEGHDLIGCAQTGSGKTAAFLLPVLQTLLNSDLEPHDPNSNCQNPYCLIISPTRELANQIYVQANMLSRDSIIKCHVIYGQVSTAHLKSKLSTGCHMLVATIGRLKDFVERGWIGFKNIKYVILDEGDRLVDDGFSSDVEGFFNHDTMPPKEKRQTLFFSATFKKETQSQARKYLKDDFVFLSVGKVGAANVDIKQEFMRVARHEKKRILKDMLAETPESEKTIIFTQTKSGADMLASFFTSLNLSSTSIHGDRHQSQREEAIKLFRKGERRFLISSPVGNRGLDLPKVSLVINYDLPNCIDEYVHRIGRTGRAGHTGRALSFYDDERDGEILPGLIQMLTEAKQPIPEWMTTSESADKTLSTNDCSDPPEAKTSSANDWGSSSNSTEAKTSSANDWGSKPNSTKTNDDDWGTNDGEW